MYMYFFPVSSVLISDSEVCGETLRNPTSLRDTAQVLTGPRRDALVKNIRLYWQTTGLPTRLWRHVETCRMAS